MTAAQGLCVPGRATVAWFKGQQPQLYSAARLPVFILHDGQRAWYGFPEFGDKPGAVPGGMPCLPASVHHLACGSCAQQRVVPLLLAGLKIGEFCVSASSCNPDSLDRRPSAADIEPLARTVQEFFPGAAGPVQDFAACMFVMTPDGHFIIDSHPRHPQVNTTRNRPPLVQPS